MRSSVTSTFSEPEEFRAAMSADGSIGLFFTGSGRFRARSTEVKLDHLRLVSVEESLPRIAFIRVPPELILVGLSIESASSLSWGGIRVDSRELITLGAGQCAHMRSEGPCHWGAIWLPAQEFTRYGIVLTGRAMEVPPGVCRWRPPAKAGNEFRSLYFAAIQTAQVRAGPATGAEAAHGLEQQLIHLLMECLSTESGSKAGPAMQRQSDAMAQFEELIRTHPESKLSMPFIKAALGISDRRLRKYCEEHLGMSPMSYVRLHRPQLASQCSGKLPRETLRRARVPHRTTALRAPDYTNSIDPDQ